MRFSCRSGLAVKRLGGRRDGANDHRDVFGTFEAALSASGLELDANQVKKVRSVIAEVTEIEGRPPDSDGFTAPTSRGELRVVWGSARSSSTRDSSSAGIRSRDLGFGTRTAGTGFRSPVEVAARVVVRLQFRPGPVGVS